MADYTTFYTAMSAWELANGESGSTYALNSYAMAGYIAGASSCRLCRLWTRRVWS